MKYDTITLIVPGNPNPRALPVYRRGTPEPTLPEGHTSWEWDGNVERPTLSPSIWAEPPEGWHGFVRDGRMVTA